MALCEEQCRPRYLCNGGKCQCQARACTRARARGRMAGPSRYLQQPFGACRRQTPRGEIESEGGVGKVSARRVSRCLQIGMGPRRLPSACSKIFKKKRTQHRTEICRAWLHMIAHAHVHACARTRPHMHARARTHPHMHGCARAHARMNTCAGTHAHAP